MVVLEQGLLNETTCFNLFSEKYQRKRRHRVTTNNSFMRAINIFTIINSTKPRTEFVNQNTINDFIVFSLIRGVDLGSLAEKMS